MAPLTATEARELFGVVDARYESRSCLVASQLPLTEWHRIIAHKFTLTGESMRKKKGGGTVTWRGQSCIVGHLPCR